MNTIPGTVIECRSLSDNPAFSFVEPVLSVTGGLTLSQVGGLTGLENSTIQNWVKRGWIANPTNKRYGEVQVARVILINMLRGAMQLENIVALMSCINGSVEDRDDDILPDRELFDLLCAVINEAEKSGAASTQSIATLAARQLDGSDFSSEVKEKLSRALTVMTLTYISAQLKKEAETEFAKLEIRKG